MYQFILRINLLKHYQLLVICFLSTMLLSACGSSDSSVVLATPVENYTISTLADSNGTITASSSVESGETVIVTIMPDSDFVVSDVLIDGVSVGPVQFYEFTNVDADHTVDATFAVENIDNIMPAGIPAPSFGIHETHLMYADQFYDAGGFEYLDAGNGPYSHYIDNTDPDASDEDNPYGTQTKPRVTIPDFVPEASVVEIHGGPYTHTRINSLRLDGVGTIEKPIFYRGTSNDSLVHIDVTAQSGYRNSAQFIIIENLRLHKYNINPSETTTVSHIALRYSEVTGDASSGGVGVASWVTDNWISDIVLYNLHIHDNGPWDTTEGDPDIHGIGIGVYVRHMWILDNKLYHNAGNAIQLIGAGPSGNNSLVHHIYMGRNYDNGKPNLQQFIGIKGSSDVIISENHVSTQGGYRTNGAMSFQYGPERIWFLFNKIHDVNGGIGSGSNSVPDPGKESYVIGNLIYNIKQKDYTDWNPNNPWSNAAIKLWGGVNRYIIGNTIHNVDAGIYSPSRGTFNIVNNIISNVTDPDARHIYLESKSQTADSLFYNNLFSQDTEDGDVRIQWGSLAGDVEFFQTSTENAQQNVDADPLFNSTSIDDFSLQATSVAIDAGISDGVVDQVFDRFELLYGLDIRHATISAGARTDGSQWDIGAYELE